MAITEHVDAASHSVLRAAVHGGRNLMEESAEEDSHCQPIEVFGVTATVVGLSILLVGAVVAARSRLGRSGRGTFTYPSCEPLRARLYVSPPVRVVRVVRCGRAPPCGAQVRRRVWSHGAHATCVWVR